MYLLSFIMTIRKTLTSIVLAGALALGVAGCKDNVQNNSRPSTAQEYAQRAESNNNMLRISMDYNRAQYLQMMEIVENNTSLLQQSGKSVDISDYLNNAREYAQRAESNNNMLRISMDYNRAQYQLNQAILEQQEALK